MPASLLGWRVSKKGFCCQLDRKDRQLQWLYTYSLYLYQDYDGCIARDILAEDVMDSKSRGNEAAEAAAAAARCVSVLRHTQPEGGKKGNCLLYTSPSPRD